MQKILFVRFSSIGDILLCSAPIRSVKRKYPHIEIHFVTKEIYKPWALALPHVDRVLTFGGDMISLKNRVKEQSYDLIVDLHNNLRSWRLCLSLSAPVVRSPRESIEKLRSIFTRQPKFKHKHVVHKYMAALSYLEMRYDGLGLDLRSPAPISSNGAIVVALGGSTVTKRLPLDLARQLAFSMPYEQFVWIGGADVVLNSELATLPNVTDQIGLLSVDLTIDLVARSKLLVTGDTGIMHVGAALKKKMIVIWGSTHPAFGFGPLYPDNASLLVRHIQVEHLTCRPCSRHGRKKCPLGHMRCIKDISANSITFATNELLSLNHSP